MTNLDQALESLFAVRNIEQIARDLANAPDQKDVAAAYAKDVIDSIERLVTYLSLVSRTSLSAN